MCRTDIARFLHYFTNFSNSFINILAILQDFSRIFLKYSLNITVLCGRLAKEQDKLVAMFIDLRAAFESVDRRVLLGALKKSG